MVSSFDWFGRVYIINGIPGRREKISAELDRLGIPEYKRDYVRAKPPLAGLHMSNMRRNPQGEFGCSLSHIKAVIYAANDRVQRPLFLEDDILFAPDAEERLAKAIKDLEGRQWQVLYLGGHPCEDVERVGECLVKVGRFSFAEAYSMPFPEVFIDYWLDRIGQEHAMYDQILGEYAKKTDGYSVFPIITRQPPGYSHVIRGHDDKTYCIESGWRNHT